MTESTDICLPADVLVELERGVQKALCSGDDEHLHILGYGEISCVLSVTSRGRTYAVKRLPPFDSEEAYEVYSEVFYEYLGALSRAGVEPVRSRLQVVKGGEGQAVQAYCIQPRHEAERLGPNFLAACGPEEGRRFISEVVAATAGCVDRMLGLDAQLSNWVATDEGVRYLDVTTPMLRDESGAPLLDTKLFLLALPWALRGVTDLFLVDEIMKQYHDRRRALLDMAANLHKERLQQWIPELLSLANRHVEPPITVEETEIYYRRDARMWAMLLWLRRMDRAWQLHVRRRPYPFLLPGEIER